MKTGLMKQPLLLWMLLIALGSLSAAGCTGDGTQPGETASTRETVRIVFVTHGQASDPFWSVVQNGARDAAAAVDARVEYQAPESFDMVTMSQLIDAAVASAPDGLVVSMPDAEALAPSVRAAIDAGIPVITINSGDDVAAQLGVLNHVGQTEYEAGYGGGERMAAAGINKAFCVNMEVGNAALDLRCRGFADAMAAAGSAVTVLPVELGDPTETQQRIQAGLSGDPAVDGILALGPTSALPALHALEQAGQLGRIAFATFDLTPEVLDAIAQGHILFAIDQQQYMQGYLPVILLSLYLRNENTIPHEVLRTGPGFVTRENVARLKQLVSQGTR